MSKIASGDILVINNFSTFLFKNGRLWCSGWNSRGKLGLGHTENVNTMTKVPWKFGTIKQISIGPYHTMILTTANELYVSGCNKWGQLEFSDIKKLLEFTRVDWTHGPIKQVSCGFFHSIILTEDNRLWVCGTNTSGELGLNAKNYEKYEDWTEINWSNGPIKEIIAEDFHSFVLTKDGEIWACGSNMIGELGLGSKDKQNVLTKVELPSGLRVKQISSSCTHTLILTEDNQLLVSGDNYWGQLGVPELEESHKFVHVHWIGSIIKQIRVGGHCIFVLTENNEIWCSGRDTKELVPMSSDAKVLTKIHRSFGEIAEINSDLGLIVRTKSGDLWAIGNNEGEKGMGHRKKLERFTQLNWQLA